MESWSVGYEGDEDVERHSGMHDARPRSAPDRPPLSVTLVSDYICPWCYIGLARLERLRDEYEITLSACAFDLRPGIPPEGISREEASKGRTYPPGYVENLRQTARQAGIEMKRPALIPNTRKAHEATEFARQSGADLWAVHRALFRAYFEEERNIGDTAVVAEVCADAGVDAGGLRQALDDGRHREEIERQMAWSRENGITGVPTTIFNARFAVVGAQDYELFSDVAGRIVRGEDSEQWAEEAHVPGSAFFAPHLPQPLRELELRSALWHTGPRLITRQGAPHGLSIHTRRRGLPQGGPGVPGEGAEARLGRGVRHRDGDGR